MDDIDDLQALGTSAITEEFTTYENYLDSQILSVDLYYLEDVEIARYLVELGLRGTGEIIKREEFEERKEAAKQLKITRLKQKQFKLSSAGMDFSAQPFLRALQIREEAVRNGRLSTIVYLRVKNKKGQEISGYIDYAHRLRTEDFFLYFDRKKKVLPNPTQDLCYYNWNTQLTTSNPTAQFQILADDCRGLLFKNKKDRKILNVDPNQAAGDNSTRTEVKCSDYLQVVLYDHISRRRN